MSEDAHQHHQHDHSCCANLFGCGDEKGTGIIREDIKDAVYDKRASDRLLHMDAVDQESFDGYLSARGRWRRKFLQASGFMGALAAVEPWFGRLAQAQGAAGPATSRCGVAQAACTLSPRPRRRCGWACSTPTCRPFSPSTPATSSAFPIPGRTSSTRCSRACPVDTLAKLRVSNPGRGPHSIIGPIAVNKAEPGDVLEIRFQTIRPYEWGAVFNNPGSLGTGLLPQDYAQGQIKYVDLDLACNAGQVHAQHHRPAEAIPGHLWPGAAGRLFPALEPRRHQLGPAGPPWGQYRSERAVGRLDALPPGMEARRRSSIRATAMRCRATARFRSPRSKRA